MIRPKSYKWIKILDYKNWSNIKPINAKSAEDSGTVNIILIINVLGFRNMEHTRKLTV